VVHPFDQAGDQRSAGDRLRRSLRGQILRLRQAFTRVLQVARDLLDFLAISLVAICDIRKTRPAPPDGQTQHDVAAVVEDVQLHRESIRPGVGQEAGYAGSDMS
jgi:hypothetical protein